MPLFTNLLGLFLNIHLTTCSYIELAATVPAGKPVQASITQTKLYNGDTALINSMRVYLAAAATNSLGPDFFDSQCTLIDSLPTCDPSIEIAPNHITFDNKIFNVTIPTDVGPPGRFYALHAQVFQTDGAKYSVEISSDVFSLTGATGNWSKPQLAGYTLWSADRFPCGSFKCVDDCADSSYGTYSPNSNSNSSEYQNCLSGCPGVKASASGSTPTGVTGSSFPTPAACSISSASASNSATFTQGTSTSDGSGSSSTPTPSASPSSAGAPSSQYPLVLTLVMALLFSGLTCFT